MLIKWAYFLDKAPIDKPKLINYAQESPFEKRALILRIARNGAQFLAKTLPKIN